MKVKAVICEYNPFHNGHKYLLDKISKDGSAVVAVMSGSFTQRGDVAITDKFNRAETALKNGADLVIELPTVYACAPAETFAFGAVEIIKSLKTVDELCFGAEDADITLLKQAAYAFDDKDFKAELRRNMQGGDYYPRAAKKAVEKVFSLTLAEVLEKPNNILAVEYIKAIKNTDIKPIAVKRVGVNHDSQNKTDGFTSASKIRSMIKSNDDYSLFVPSYIVRNIADIKNLERTILYKLRTMSVEDIKNLPEVSEGLENRIFEATKNSASLDELFERIKTKRYTLARIRRIIISAALGITEDLPKQEVQYIRVLGFNGKGMELLSEINKRCSLPLITNVADGYRQLDKNARKIFDIDILANDVLNLATNEIGVCKTDFTRGIIKI